MRLRTFVYACLLCLALASVCSAQDAPSDPSAAPAPAAPLSQPAITGPLSGLPPANFDASSQPRYASAMAATDFLGTVPARVQCSRANVRVGYYLKTTRLRSALQKESQEQSQRQDPAEQQDKTHLGWR